MSLTPGCVSVKFYIYLFYTISCIVLLYWCDRHYPKTTATVVADTPELARLTQNTKLQSQVIIIIRRRRRIDLIFEIPQDHMLPRVKKKNKNNNNKCAGRVQRPDESDLESVYGCFQNLTLTFLSKFTFVVKFSWRSDQFFQRHELLNMHLRSASSNQLVVPRHRRTQFGRRAFSVAGPMAWNALPDSIRDTALSTCSFRRYLKTLLFSVY